MDCFAPLTRNKLISYCYCSMSWTSHHPPFCFIHEGRPKAGAELAMTDVELRRGQLLRREAAVECLALGRHLNQEIRRREARAVFGFQFVAQLDEFLGTH